MYKVYSLDNALPLQAALFESKADANKWRDIQAGDMLTWVGHDRVLFAIKDYEENGMTEDKEEFISGLREDIGDDCDESDFDREWEKHYRVIVEGLEEGELESLAKEIDETIVIEWV